MTALLTLVRRSGRDQLLRHLAWSHHVALRRPALRISNETPISPSRRHICEYYESVEGPGRVCRMDVVEAEIGDALRTTPRRFGDAPDFKDLDTSFVYGD
jgi:hypothetical protein